MFRFRKVDELDTTAPLDPAKLDVYNPSQVVEILCYYLQTMDTQHATALDIFVHEEEQQTRACMWMPRSGDAGQWVECVPTNLETGIALLRWLRSGAKHTRRDCGFLCGKTQYRTSEGVRSLTLESPHEWEVRLYAEAKRPSCLPYVLVHAEVARRRAPQASE